MKISSWFLLMALVITGVRNTSAIEQIYTIQSDWSSQTQNKWFGDYYVTGGQSDGTLKVGGWGDHYVSMIKIPLNFNVPGRVLINGADLHLYSYGSSRPTTMQKLFWFGPWSQSSTSDHWTLVNNGQYGTTGHVPAPPVTGWYTMDFSTEFFVWLVGTYPNNGIGLYPDNNDNRFNNFYSPQGPGGGLSLRPFITVRYEVIPNFKMPLDGSGGKSWRLNTECGGKAIDTQSIPGDHFHTGQTYYSLDFGHYYLPNGGSTEIDTTGTDVQVLAMAAGRVYETGTDLSKANGNYVKIDHDFDGSLSTGFQTVYLHLKNAPLVRVGDTVQQGQVLGVMGGTGTNPDTGTSYPVHLHVTFYFKGTAGPNGSDSAQLNFTAMEGTLLTDYKLGTTWNPTFGWVPHYCYASSNIPR